MNQTRAQQERQQAVYRQRHLAWVGRPSSSIGGNFTANLEPHFVVLGRPRDPAGLRASSFATHPAPWVEQVYALVESRQHGDAIDLIYDMVEPMLAADMDKVDTLLSLMDTSRLGAEEIVSVLIVTLGAKDRLRNRADFISRSRDILAREDEGADGVLHGLV
jgi:hypothetical protein